MFGDVLAQHFDGDIATQARIVSLVHAAHSARADWGADPIRTYLHPRLQTHGTYILEQAGSVLPCWAIQRAVSGKSINEKVRLYARVGQALIEARSSGGDVFAAIESVLPWSKFESTVAEAQRLAQPEEFDYLSLLDERYSSVRKFAPLLLANFEFRAAPAAAELLQALALLRDLNTSGKRTLPDHVPIGFVKPRWRPHVFSSSGVDRHFYEMCALAELRDRLQSGDIWVTGSRQYRDFETYLIPAEILKDICKKTHYLSRWIRICSPT
jgi:hypothetical protein